MTCKDALQKLLDCARRVPKGDKVICNGHTSWIVDPKTNEDVDGRLILIDEQFYQELLKELDSQKTFAEMAGSKANG
jgi:outer membrane lipoprotein-sorting protein